MTTPPPPGWHPDPGDARQLRWWDGNQWTDYTKSPESSPGDQQPPGGGGTQQQGQGYPPNGGPPTGYNQPYGQGRRGMGYGMGGMGMGRGYGRFGMRGPNSLSWTAIIFGGIYLVIALATGFAIIGIVPVLYTFRAFQRREKLAPLAAVISAIVVIIAVVSLTHGHH
jgi:Protein of unknown function (DUF2510)